MSIKIDFNEEAFDSLLSRANQRVLKHGITMMHTYGDQLLLHVRDILMMAYVEGMKEGYQQAQSNARQMPVK
jgi:hypothetical protein